MPSTPISTNIFATAAKSTTGIFTNAVMCGSALAQNTSGLISERSISTDADMAGFEQIAAKL